MKKIRKIRILKNNKNAQAAVELAILGAILLFVFGMLIRYGMNFAETQNMQYKAFREALRLSGNDALEGQYYVPNDDLPRSDAFHPKGNRKNSSVILIEDRPTVQGGEKYGASSRSPYMASGSGVFSSLLQLPLEFGETENLPVMDIIVNGQHFTFRTAKLIRYLTHPDLSTMAEDICWHLVNNIHCWSRTIGDVAFPNVGPQYIDWSEAGGIPFPHPWRLSHSSWKGTFFDSHPGLGYDDVRFVYTKLPFTHKKFLISGGGAEGLKRFDLHRDGNIVPPGKRGQMVWQWYPVALTSIGIDLYSSSWTSLDVDGDLKEETVMSFVTREPGNEEKDNIHYKATGTNYEDESGADLPDPTDDLHHGYNVEPYKNKAIAILNVIDYNEGDLDTTYNKTDKEIFGIEQPGLLQESSIKSYVPRDEGGGTFVIDQQMSGAATRTQTATQSKTSYDIIERKIRLSNNTGCFCPEDNPFQDNGAPGCRAAAIGNPPSWDEDWEWPDHTPGNKKPPYCASDNLSVKYACEGEGCCNEEVPGPSGTNNRSTSTCFEYHKVIGPGEGSQNLVYNDHYMLYIRSTIASKSGYKTITTEDVETINY